MLITYVCIFLTFVSITAVSHIFFQEVNKHRRLGVLDFLSYIGPVIIITVLITYIVTKDFQL